MACSGLRKLLLSKPSLLVALAPALGPAPPSLVITGEGGDQKYPPLVLGLSDSPSGGCNRHSVLVKPAYGQGQRGQARLHAAGGED